MFWAGSSLAVLGKNWVKVDVTKNTVGEILEREIPAIYSDYPQAVVSVESLESILAGKLRAMLQRKKCRDYYDVWKMISLKIDFQRAKGILTRKCDAKGVSFTWSNVFPDGLAEILAPYWEKELSRLLSPVPRMDDVVSELESVLPSRISQIHPGTL